MRPIYLIFILIIMSFPVFSQHDTLIVIKMKLVPDTTVGGVHGVSLMLSMKHVYDSLYHGQPAPSTVFADIELMEGKKPVTAVKSTRSYRLNNGSAGFRTQPQTHGVIVKNIHIPYYALDLKEGKYNVDFRITAWQNDTTTFASSGYRIRIKHDSIFSAKINVPEKEYFKVLVSGVRAMDTDFDGKQWDYNLLSGAPPDIVWKVLASEYDRVDYFFVSPNMKNSYSAAWLDGTGVLCLSKGDRFYIKVYDNDPVYDDLMASVQLTLDEMIAISQKNKEMETGRLTYFKLSGERVIPTK